MQRRPQMRTNFKLTLASAVLIACSSAAWAGAPQTFSDELILDWDDLRGMLRDRGIDFRVGYISETATNAQGGNEQLWRYADQWTFSLKLDLQRLFGLNQARFDVVITDRNGRSLSADADLGSLQEVQEIYGRGQTWRWTEFWYGQKYFDGALDWEIGRLPPGNDFAAFSCEFMNLTFCGSAPGNIAGGYWYNWPVSQWATRIKENLSGFGYIQLGAYEVNPSYLLTKYAMDLGSPPGATGVLLPLEIGWLPSFRGLSGSYKVGAWYNTSTASDVVSNAEGQPLDIYGGQPLMHHGTYGAYLNFEQRLTAPEGTAVKRGLSVFVNATYADRRTTALDSQIAMGLLYTGPFARRPSDLIGLAVGETHVNSRIADAQRELDELGYGPVAVQTYEWAGEVFYNFHVAGWLDLRPSVQYVIHPGGTSQNSNDLILGLRVAVNL
jgi:porin